jgi:hypothetical protein
MKKILMDLHPCFSGYAGIPQDTRVTFGLLADSDKFELGGHLFDNNYGTSGFIWKDYDDVSDKLNQMSEYIIALDSGERRYDHGMSKSRLFRKILKTYCSSAWGRMIVRHYVSRGYLKPDNRLHEIDAEFFHDYIWRTLFQKSLHADKKPNVVSAKFFGCSTSRALMMRVLRAKKFIPSINTTGWDAYLSQTPFPGKISESTKQIIRFHDAVPIQNPTTINKPYDHHQAVSRSLKLNVKNSHFICNSNATKEQLMSLFPQIGDRVHIVHCCVPDVFKQTQKQSVRDIISKCANTQIVNVSGFSDVMRYKSYVEEHFNDEYFIAVGTIEPRKNYSSILEGWNRFKKATGKKTKLVIVGNSGWGEDTLLSQISTHCHNGDVFLLNNVSVHELIDLYSNALACIVASYTEGFSYSGIEAMRCNTPVIASDVPVHREVYCEHALYFDPYSQDQLPMALDKITNYMPEEVEKKAKAANEYSKKFGEIQSKSNWESTLNVILNA